MNHVRTVARVRPLSSREAAQGRRPVVHLASDRELVVADPDGANEAEDWQHAFAFDAVLADAAQDAVFDAVGRAAVADALEGYNSAVFAYGQTGAGKTYTMVGERGAEGLVFRIARQILASAAPEAQLRVSCYEIYNERARDLLGAGDAAGRVREHPERGAYVEGLTSCAVDAVARVQELFERSCAARTTAVTEANPVSSRSHAVFTLHLAQPQLASRVHLVDLAGSERQRASGAAGERLREASSINRSLSTLNDVIRALAQGGGGHVPYRNSLLTRLLKDALGGNARTVMVAAVSPCDAHFEETLSTLRYVQAAKRVETQAVVNVRPESELVQQLRAELAALKNSSSSSSSSGPELKEAVDKWHAAVGKHRAAITSLDRERRAKRRVQADGQRALGAARIGGALALALRGRVAAAFARWRFDGFVAAARARTASAQRRCAEAEETADAAATQLAEAERRLARDSGSARTAEAAARAAEAAARAADAEDRAEARVAEASARVADAESRAAEAQAQAEAKVTAAEARAAEAQAQAEARAAEAQARAQDAQAQADEERAEREEAQRELVAQAAAAEEAERRATAAESDAAAAAAQQLDAAARRAAAAEEQLRHTAERAGSKDAHAAELAAELATLREQQAQAAQAARAETEAAQAEARAARDEAQAARDEAQAARAETRQQAQIFEMRLSMALGVDSLEQAKAQLDSARSASEEAETRVAELQARLASAGERAAAAERQMAAHEEEASARESRLLDQIVELEAGLEMQLAAGLAKEEQRRASMFDKLASAFGE